MTRKKVPSKTKASEAGKTLSTSKSKAAKSAAAKTLAKKSASVRKVQSAPKKGTISRSSVRKAIRTVSSSKKRK